MRNVRSDNFGSDCAHSVHDDQPIGSPVIAEIFAAWKMRQRWHRAEKALVLQGKAICRSFAAGDKEAANKLFDGIQAGKIADPMLSIALLPFLSAVDQFEKDRKNIEKRLKTLVRSLPIYQFTKDIRGFGEGNLAAIVGEAGDLGDYRNPSCVWKRFGLAVFDGQRQRRVLDAELAIKMGYSPPRRAVAYLLGECIVKQNKGEYRQLYNSRKEYELARTDDNKPKSKKHAHNRAMRYMVKRLLRDMWRFSAR